jgi:hypothetical protein
MRAFGLLIRFASAHRAPSAAPGAHARPRRNKKHGGAEGEGTVEFMFMLAA